MTIYIGLLLSVLLRYECITFVLLLRIAFWMVYLEEDMLKILANRPP